MAAVKCPICDKAVYKMEEIVALGRTWHKLCFRCAATAPEDPDGKEIRCGKKLNLMDYSERKNPDGGESIPYCKTCYEKNFAPSGYGTNMSQYRK